MLNSRAVWLFHSDKCADCQASRIRKEKQPNHGGCCAGRVFLQSDVEEAVTDMYHTFRQHASAEFDVDLSGCPVSEESLLQGINSSASASGTSALAGDISDGGNAAVGSGAHSSSQEGAERSETFSRTQSLDPPSAAEQPDTEHEHDRGKEHHAAAQAATNSGGAEQELDDPSEVECYTKEAIEWQHTNPLVRPYCVVSLTGMLLIGRCYSVIFLTDALKCVPEEGLCHSLCLPSACRVFLQSGKFTLCRMAVWCSALCFNVFDNACSFTIIQT